MHPFPVKRKKLKKYQVVLLVTLAILFTALVLARITYGLQYYSIPTSSNEPTINVGDYIFSSNLRKPNRFDFICYRMNDSMFGKQIWVHRLCGLPGDRIEIRNDTLFVNGENADEKLNLCKNFVIPNVDLEEHGIAEEDVSLTGSKDSIYVTLQTRKDSDLIKRGRPFTDAVMEDPYIKRVYNQQWTVSNFGPYVVPPGKYFVIGDNRHASQDSRYTGPLDVNQYVGTVIGKQ